MRKNEMREKEEEFHNGKLDQRRSKRNKKKSKNKKRVGEKAREGKVRGKEIEKGIKLKAVIR